MKMLEKIKELCDRSGISIHKLEMDLGFSNGSLTKAKTLPFDRVVAITEYFQVSIDYFLSDEEAPNPVHDEKIEKALELYEQYKNAIPEIQVAVESLLKSQQPNS